MRAHQSSGNNFFHFSLFSSFHLKRCVDLVKLQNGPQSFNCIEFDLVVFQFHSLTFDFLYFFYQIWSLFYWFLFILLLIFFYWILFFDFIFNFFYYNFFLIWSSFLWLQLLLFWVLFLIDFCFGNFILHFLISLNFHIIFSVYFFYHTFKTRPGSQPSSCLESRVRSND